MAEMGVSESNDETFTTPRNAYGADRVQLVDQGIADNRAG